MSIRKLFVILVAFCTVAGLTSCIRTSYVGKWKTNYNGLDIVYDFKVEYYEVESTGMVNDSAFHSKYKGVLYIDGQRLFFTQTMRYDFAENKWTVEEGKQVSAVYKVTGNKMTLTYDGNMVMNLEKIK